MKEAAADWTPRRDVVPGPSSSSLLLLLVLEVLLWLVLTPVHDEVAQVHVP
jgi:hypothetical protein